LVERPIFPQARAWLAGEVPIDPQAATLRDHFAARLRRKPPLLVIPPVPGAWAEAMRRGLYLG
jgi:hypothetical protein